jgi:hypothetical protein
MSCSLSGVLGVKHESSANRRLASAAQRFGREQAAKHVNRVVRAIFQKAGSAPNEIADRHNRGNVGWNITFPGGIERDTSPHVIDDAATDLRDLDVASAWR